MEIVIFIYGLKDPRTTQIKYVGQSVQPAKRLTAHISDAVKNPISLKSNWIRELSRVGLEPELEILDIAVTSTAKAIEKEWIKNYWVEGILNKVVGGSTNRQYDQFLHNILESKLIPLEEAASFFKVDTNIFFEALLQMGFYFCAEPNSKDLFVSDYQINRRWEMIKAVLYGLRLANKESAK